MDGSNPKPADDFRTLVPARCKEAAEALVKAFTWEESAEGHDYWNAIYERLLALTAIKGE